MNAGRRTSIVEGRSKRDLEAQISATRANKLGLQHRVTHATAKSFLVERKVRGYTLSYGAEDGRDLDGTGARSEIGVLSDEGGHRARVRQGAVADARTSGERAVAGKIQSTWWRSGGRRESEGVTDFFSRRIGRGVGRCPGPWAGPKGQTAERRQLVGFSTEIRGRQRAWKGRKANKTSRAVKRVRREESSAPLSLRGASFSSRR